MRPVTPFLARREQFDRIGSTNDVVREWLADGTPEICLAVAEEQTAGRGRDGRTWIAPPGTAVLVSLGFRPRWLAPDSAWQLAAISTLALADAAEAAAGLPAGTIRLKWPNDLVAETGPSRAVRKLAGVLGETAGLGGDDPRVIIGLGLNADWRATDFPADLAGSITSLRELAGDRAIDRDRVLAAFLAALEPRIAALRRGAFDGVGWASRQVTTGRTIRIQTPGGETLVEAVGVDITTGALLVADEGTTRDDRDVRRVLVGEITHVRLTGSILERV